jgi:uncharacterized membrane protein YoaK (UPF0700 family)
MLEAVLFALIAGYADAIGYLRFGAFAGMMTGNTVLMGLAVLHGAERSFSVYAALIALFFAAAVVANLVLPRVRPSLLLIGESLLILLADAIRADWAIAFIVAAMGLQNPIATRLGVPLSTTFITGDILRFAEGIVRRIGAGSAETPRTGFAIYGWVWLGYAIGAALGAGGHAVLRWPLIVPFLLLVLIYLKSRKFN